jgi:hypothetical protein
VQELKGAIRSLHIDSKRKMDQEHEMQCALESLVGQMQAVREGLCTLSEAFIEESGKHHHRISQVTLATRPCTSDCHSTHRRGAKY